MSWKTLLASITGTVDPDLLLRHESLGTEHRLRRHKLKGRLRLNNDGRKALAEIGQQLGTQARKDVATIVQRATILGEHRQCADP